MKEAIKRYILISLGVFFVALGIVGIVLPILPTTPLLILALVLFSKSSPRFHQMLLNNRWVGPGLRQWEESRAMTRKDKRRATIAIVITFTVSIAILRGRIELQLMLVGIAIVLLFFMWRIKEPQQ